MRVRVWLAALCLATGWSAPLSGQAADEPIDRVIAVVGSSAITYTQLQEEFFTRYSVRGLQPPTDPATVRREMRMLVDTLINAELLYQEALQDTMITVSAIEINDAVDETMRQMRQQVSSEVAFQAELRRAGFLGIDDYRRWLAEQQGRELMQRRKRERLLSEGVVAPVAPTEREVRAFYDERKNLLPPQPPTVSLKQIVIRPKPSQASRDSAFRLADSLAVAIREGADFAVAARRFSQDVASAQRGGDLDWFRRGRMVRPFEEVAFSLPRGTVSDPVETVFGFHVIQVQQVQPTEVKARHILIMPTVDSTDMARARSLADSLRALVVAGASFDSLQVLYHDPSEEREAVGAIIDSLGPVYGRAIEGVPDGGVSEVFALAIDGSGAPPKYAFVRVLERRPAGPQPYDQLRERIRKVLGESMGWQKYFNEMRQKVHIEIREL